MELPVQVLLALGTAAAFATSSVLVRFGVERSTPMAAMFATISVNVVVLWAISLALYDVTVDLWAWRYFILAGLFAPVIGRLCNYIGLERVGVNLTLPISNSNPLVSVVLAILLLGETLTRQGGVGALAAIAGGILLATAGRGDGSAVDVRYRDLLFPIAGAVIYGSVQLLRNVGMELVPEPAVGAAVNLTTSWLVAAAFFAVASNHRAALSIPFADLRYFVLAGIASSLGLICLYAALRSGTVVIVTPILNTTPLFALVFTFVFLREREPFTPQVISGTVLVVVGVGLLATST
ncbi:DMT family transporter [Natrarchaeobius halalkaliphilus]|uniref:DMT family transporter n=1 Tax=Natrarchaeobius halalkaliphilus TaxID=1679091 RepID=A0A3N6LME5_9EURY|nr:DMT family transporter [Natrarchaeobius halalkaliphilus]RQG86695.1 DMT family transporter [Natrarchaeobius halalkaliphilus]